MSKQYIIIFLIAVVTSSAQKSYATDRGKKKYMNEIEIIISKDFMQNDKKEANYEIIRQLRLEVNSKYGNYIGNIPISLGGSLSIIDLKTNEVNKLSGKNIQIVPSFNLNVHVLRIKSLYTYIQLGVFTNREMNKGVFIAIKLKIDLRVIPLDMSISIRKVNAWSTNNERWPLTWNNIGFGVGLSI